MIQHVTNFVKRHPRFFALAGAIPVVPVFAFYSPLWVELNALIACCFLLGVVIYVDVKSDPVP